MPPTEDCHLYRFFDQQKNLLYVGVTANPGVRLTHHRRHKSWWREVATCTIEHFDNEDDALVAEKNAIQSEHPVWNSVSVIGNKHENKGVNAASAARVINARRRRFQRYLDEMVAAGCAQPQDNGFYSVLLDEEPAVESSR